VGPRASHTLICSITNLYMEVHLSHHTLGGTTLSYATYPLNIVLLLLSLLYLPYVLCCVLLSKCKGNLICRKYLCIKSVV